MKISQMTSPRSGRHVANQFILFTPEATFFQSYNSIIVKTCFEDDKRKVYLDDHFWDYSVTTSKYRNMFLGEDIKTIRKKIESGEYTLTDLN